MRDLVNKTASDEIMGIDYLINRIDILSVKEKPTMLLAAAMGLCGEAGEFSELIKKWVFHRKDLDIVHAKKELGDILWYFTLACEALDTTREEIEEIVKAKLKARYKDGFSEEEANNREKDDI